MKKLIVSVVLLTVAGVAGAQQTSEIVATINGETLTKKQFDRMWSALSPEMQRNYEQSGGKIQFLDNYIRKRLIVQEAIKEKFDQREEVKFILDQAKESALFDAYIRMEVSKEVVPESELREIYRKQEDKYIRPPMVKARHIIATPDGMAVNNRTNSNAESRPEAHEKMINIRRQLETNPQSFVDLAMQFSEDGSAPSGGDLGWFAAGQMVPEFDEIVFDLKPGQISQVFETRFGYHVVMVEEVRGAGVVPFEEAKEQIREELLKERTQQILAKVQALTQELRGVSNISVNRENL